MTEKSSGKLIFGGDFAPSGRYCELIDESGGDIFGDLKKVIAEADVSICNLEVPLCEVLSPIAKSGPSLRAEPTMLKALTEAGFGGVCLANNHIFDFGKEGLRQTLETVRSHGLFSVGAGLDRGAAEACHRFELSGKRVSLFAFAEHENNWDQKAEAGSAILDPLRIGPLLVAERAHADAILVCFHGGNELFNMPRPGLRRMCQFMVDLGADAVIGHHPHVPGPYEIYRGRPIIYSLGNLLMDSEDPPVGWEQGYLAAIELKFNALGPPISELKIIPYTQSFSQGGVRLLQGDSQRDFITRIENLRAKLEKYPEEWLAIWNAFVENKREQAEIDLFSPVRFRGLRRLMRFGIIRRIVSSPSRRLHRLNLLRCASHRELVISALERETVPVKED